MDISSDTATGTTIIMAGGLGTRMGNPEKALIMVDESPLIQGVIAFGLSVTPDLRVCCSVNTPELCAYCDRKGLKYIRSGGRGYEQDIVECLRAVHKFPVLVLPGDVFLHGTEILREAVRYAFSLDDDVISILQLGEYTGISVFRRQPTSPPGTYSSLEIPVRFCVNINKPSDLSILKTYR